MAIDEAAHQYLQANLTTLRGLRANKQLDDAGYYMGVVCVAYEYAVNDSLGQALTLLGTIPETYYSGPAQEQMAANPAYYDVASELAIILVAGGYAGLESDDLRPTQAPATA